MQLSSGSRIGSYEIVAPIGAGGMGEVWRARDPRLGRDVAIKILPPSVVSHPDRLARFTDEARAAGTLNHPNLVTIHEFGTHEGAPFIVMELLEGETLRERLGTSADSLSGSGAHPRLPMRKALDYSIQIANGLAAAHEHAVIHRDLKPDNIFVTSDGRVKILDFGLAKLAPSRDSDDQSRTAQRKTAPGTVMGTAGYMAPEQVRGRDVDHRADIFSLGAILYEMLSGERAFKGDSSIQTMNAVLESDPPDLSGSNPQITPGLQRVVERCLEKKPEERFHSAHDVAFALDAVSRTSGVPLSGASPLMGRRRWRPLLLAVAAIAAAAVAFVLGKVSDSRNAAAPVLSEPDLPHFTQLTFTAGGEFQPTISPDGTAIAYTSRAAGNLDIYFLRVGGENPINLTKDCPMADSMPAFSADGQQIAYRSECNGGGIFVMGATGESARRLVDNGFNPAWSPDDKEIAYNTSPVIQPFGRPSLGSLWCVSVSSGQTRMVEKEDAVQPSWSRDGRRIAFWGLPTGTGKRVLYTIPAAGGKRVALTDDAWFNWNPVWSADGRFLYFLTDRTGSMNLWRMQIDPQTGARVGESRPVSVASQDMMQLSISRDGNLMAYTVPSPVSIIERYPLDRAGRISGPPGALYSGSRRYQEEVLDSPDGQGFLVRTAPPRQEDLFVIRSDGSSTRRITNDSFRARDSAWTADGKRILFMTDRSGRYEIWSVSADGSGLRQETNLEGDTPGILNVTSDGKWLIMALTRGEVRLDLTVPLAQRKLEPFPPVSANENFVVAVVSLDGKQAVGNTLRGGDIQPGLVLYDFATRSYKKLPGVSTLEYRAWMPDSRRFVYSTRRQLMMTDPAANTSAVYLTMPRDVVVDGFDFSRDGAWLYVMERREESDIWMADFSGEKAVRKGQPPDNQR
ncbi:MAG: protein kinase [Acidobacteriota bacterium]